MALAVFSALLLVTTLNAARRTTSPLTGVKLGALGWAVIAGLLSLIGYSVFVPH